MIKVIFRIIETEVNCQKEPMLFNIDTKRAQILIHIKYGKVILANCTVSSNFSLFFIKPGFINPII